MVLAFAEAGYAVAFSFKGDEEPSNTLMEEVEAQGGQALGIQCDVGSAAEVDEFFDEVCSWYGDAPDVLINNAGIQAWHLCWNFPKMIGTTLFAPI